MILVNTPGSWAYIYSPLTHADWHGYTPTDLVFPFFLVAVGLSMSFSFQKFDESSQKSFYIKTVRRTLLIFLIGLALNAFPFIEKDFSQLRIMGVLQRIAIAYFIASIIVYNVRNTKQLIFSAVSILFTYWVILILFGGGSPYSLESNFGRTLDLIILGDAHMWHGKKIAFDPEGILSSFPAAVSVISGYLLGLLIRNYKDYELIAKILLISCLIVFIGYAWGLLFPINKSLWTSSYVLVSSGIAGIILGLLIYIIDHRKKSQWALPFEVFGLNPLISFVLSILWVKIYFLIRIDGTSTYGWLYQNIFKDILNPTFGSLIFAITHVVGVWIIAYLLYRKRIVIKL